MGPRHMTCRRQLSRLYDSTDAWGPPEADGSDASGQHQQYVALLQYMQNIGHAVAPQAEFPLPPPL
jgi:hypothetical protein